MLTIGKNLKYNWVENFVVARSLLGWSEVEFWAANPRMFYAFLFTYTDLKTTILNDSIQNEVLVGKDAINALAHICK